MYFSLRCSLVATSVEAIASSRASTQPPAVSDDFPPPQRGGVGKRGGWGQGRAREARDERGDDAKQANKMGALAIQAYFITILTRFDMFFCGNLSVA